VNGVPKRFKGYCTDVFFEEAMDFATQHKDEPFFTYIACNAPHSPFNVANRYSVRKTYFLRHLYVKTIILPRQARDKHRENSKKGRFSQDRYTEATRYLGEEADDRANFYGMVTCIDDNVQRMRDHLDDLGARPPAFYFRSCFRSACLYSWIM
jgi:arylsulfatase A-like enzyme